MKESRTERGCSLLDASVLRSHLIAAALLMAALLLSESDAFTQAPPVVWAKQVSGVYNHYPNNSPSSAAVDKDGHWFLAASFDTPTVLVGNQVLTNTSSGQGANAFVAKYNTSDDDLLWIRQIGCDGTVAAFTCTADAAGNLIVALYTAGSNVVVGTNTLVSNGGNNILLVKYDSAGNVLWAQLLAGSGGVYLPCLATDPVGSVFLSATYTGTNLTIGTNALTKTDPSNGADFLAKFNSGGNPIWARQVSISTTASNAPLVAVDGQGNSYLFESFETVADFGSVSVTNAISNTKYDPSGNVLWSRTVANPGGAELTGVAADSQGNSFFTGYGNPQLQSVSLPSGVAFVAQCDSSGNVVWGNSITGDYYEVLGTKGVALDLLSNCYLMGSSGSTNTGFGGITLTNMDRGVFGSVIGHGFIAKYSPNGNVLWARLLATPGVYNGGTGTVDSQGNVFYAGSATGTNFFALDDIVLPTPTNGNYQFYFFAAKISGPALSIKSSGNDVVISWPTNAVGLSLESSTDLNGGWSPVTNTPGVVGEQFVVTNAVAGGSRYYRLRNF